MAANYIIYDKATDVMRPVTRGIQMVLEGRQILIDALAVLNQLKDGDGSQAAHFDLMATQGGFSAGDYATANDAAKASYDEINSALFKLTTDTSVTDVSAAISQVAAKHGIVG